MQRIDASGQPVIDWTRLEQVVRRDPARRGLASYVDDDGRTLLAGELRAAADELISRGSRVLVVTGFCILLHDGTVTAETDGPPGAIYLAAMLRAAGIDATIATDDLGAPLIRSGLIAAQLPSEMLVAEPQGSYSHLIAIERVGPSHTAASVAAHYGATAAAIAEFEALTAACEPGVCRNMRGVSIDAHTAPLHQLFEHDDGDVGAPRPMTIGIVDGGNEIGCGNIPWHVLHRAVAQGSGATIACRIKTNHTILAGVSNWGGYALGAAVAALRGRRDAVEAWTVEHQRKLIETMVEKGGAVDGVTKRPEATVDGLSMADYLAVFSEIRDIALGR
jgi:hypothetical protein